MKKEKIEAFKTLFGFDITDFDSIYRNSLMICLFKTLEEAREVKKAYEILKEAFDWKEEFSIYKYNNGMYAVEDSSQVEIHDGIEKIE